MFACKTMKTFWLPSCGRRPPQGVHSSPKSFSAPDTKYFGNFQFQNKFHLLKITSNGSPESKYLRNSIFSLEHFQNCLHGQNNFYWLTDIFANLQFLLFTRYVSNTWKIFQSKVEAPWGSWVRPLRFLESPWAHSQCPCSCPLPQSRASFSVKENSVFFSSKSYFL